jgi:hypothetical protein
MSATSSLQTLDLEKSNGSVQRVQSRRPSAPASYEFDGRTDDDYFGHQEDVSDMKVGAVILLERFSASTNTDIHGQRMRKSQRLVRNFEMVSTMGFTSCVMGYVKSHRLPFEGHEILLDARLYLFQYLGSSFGYEWRLLAQRRARWAILVHGLGHLRPILCELFLNATPSTSHH